MIDVFRVQKTPYFPPLFLGGEQFLFPFVSMEREGGIKMKKYLILGWAFLLAAGISGCQREKSPPQPPLIENVEWERYLGKWYEIARYPNPFQKKAGLCTAEYSFDPKDPRRIKVENAVWNKEGKKISHIKGWAYFLPGRERSRGLLRVSFQWPFYGDYRIVFLSEDYKISIVTSSAGKYLWILARTPFLPEAEYKELLHFLQKNGFDTAQLITSFVQDEGKAVYFPESGSPPAAAGNHR